MKTMSAIALLSLVACGDGLGTKSLDLCATPSGVMATCKPVNVVKFGDSITADEEQTMLPYLPQGSNFENRGVYGATALHMILNDMPAWRSDTYYVISYGANECLHRFSVEQYINDMRTILVAGAGQKIYIEAPWRMTGCLERIDSYRTALVGLSAELRVPLVDEDLRQDDSPDGIHLTGQHETYRVSLVAKRILEIVK